MGHVFGLILLRSIVSYTFIIISISLILELILYYLGVFSASVLALLRSDTSHICCSLLLFKSPVVNLPNYVGVYN